MDLFEQPVLLMAWAIVLSIGIERLLELLRALEDHYEARHGTAAKWHERAERLRDRIEVRLEIAKGAGHATLQRVLTLAARYLSPAPAGSAGLIVISTDQVRTLSISLLCKIYGVVLGIALAYLFRIDLFLLVDAAINHPAPAQLAPATWYGMALSGIAMGLGAGPLHKMITALERVHKAKR